MKFRIKDEIKGRLRVHLDRQRLDCDQADSLQRFLEEIPGVYKVKVYERTADPENIDVDRLSVFSSQTSMCPTNGDKIIILP